MQLRTGPTLYDAKRDSTHIDETQGRRASTQQSSRSRLAGHRPGGDNRAEYCGRASRCVSHG